MAAKAAHPAVALLDRSGSPTQNKNDAVAYICTLQMRPCRICRVGLHPLTTSELCLLQWQLGRHSLANKCVCRWQTCCCHQAMVCRVVFSPSDMPAKYRGAQAPSPLCNGVGP